jgi:hypothetical protein
MSPKERRKMPPGVRKFGSHADKLPEEPSSGSGLNNTPFKGDTITQHRPMAQAPGQIEALDFGETSPAPIAPEPLVFYGPEKPHLKRWFKKGTKLYTLEHPVPRTSMESKNRVAVTLDEPMELDIDIQDLVWSKKLGKWRENPKKEHKTTLFGAFVIIDIFSTGVNGGQIIARRLFASLNDLQKEADNPFARFKAATK